MRRLRKSENVRALANCLRQDLVKNIGNICEPDLYNKCHRGTKKLIEKYHNEIIRCIRKIYFSKPQKISPQLKVKFFAETRQSYGQTALLLSGGASFAKFHSGLLKALWE